VNPDHAKRLSDASPQLFLNGKSALVRSMDSPTGFLLVHPGASPLDEFVAAVDAEIAAGRMRLVFWTCDIEGHKGVEWTHGEYGLSTPRCMDCGRTGVPR